MKISTKQLKRMWMAGAAVTALLTTSLVSFSDTDVPAKGVPPDVKEISFEQKLNSQVPLDLKFRDSNGKHVTLQDYFGDKPVILSLVYYECPMLCTLVLDGYVKCLNEMGFKVGDEFVSLTVSFDHEETHVLAAGKKKSYLGEYKHKGVENDWHFLVGEEESVKILTEAVGFQFKWIPEAEEYAHRSGIIVITPEGKVSRYFPGVEYDPQGVKFGLMEAAKHKLGSIVDRLSLLCYHYDPAIGKYSIVITRVINVACVVTFVMLLTSIAMFIRFERRHRRLNNLAEA
ncbi:MAG: SCO family protein, partial [Verrucomicrobiota bacterium]